MEFIWEGCTVPGQGWGGVLQGTEGFPSLGEASCHSGANTFRFLQRLMFSTCRNTLRGKILCMCSASKISPFYLQNRLILCAHTLLLGRMAQKGKIWVQISIAPKVLAHEDSDCCAASSQLWINTSLTLGQTKLLQEKWSYILNHVACRSREPGNEGGRY